MGALAVTLIIIGLPLFLVGVYVISFIWEIGKGIRNTARDIRTSRAMIAAAEAER